MAKTERVERHKQAEKRGRHGETLAALLLRCKGYRILGRRVRTRAGEIDLVAKSPSGIVCFVEVKARPQDGLAAEAVAPRQRARIARAAELYLAGRQAAKGVRFDVVTVVPGRLPRHLRDVWSADGL
ncbi:MAG TPA: YraN family protein [Rhizomicrobium sp.]